MWVKARPGALEPIKLHHLRHTCASVMIAAGINAKALSTYMGHSSIQVTFDLYGHLMPGYMDEAAEMLDANLMRAGSQAIPQNAKSGHDRAHRMAAA